MKITQKYSHLNGEEYLLVHHKKLYEEIINTVNSTDATHFMNKESKEKTMKGKMLFSPISLNKEFSKKFNAQVYSGGVINLGIEILPTKKMQSQMSSGVAYYESEVYNVLRHGRNNPPVPLLILGIES